MSSDICDRCGHRMKSGTECGCTPYHVAVEEWDVVNYPITKVDWNEVYARSAKEAAMSYCHANVEFDEDDDNQVFTAFVVWDDGRRAFEITCHMEYNYDAVTIGNPVYPDEATGHEEPAKNVQDSPNPITTKHWYDSDGNPEGGQAFGGGFAIAWQRGPLGRGKDRKPPNGAFVEHVIMAVIDRIKFYQESAFSCYHNAKALISLEAALESLQKRTAERETRGVEGTHEK